MLTAAPPMCFLATTDTDRARAFYTGILGLRFLADDGFALVFELGGGVPFRLQKLDQFAPHPFTALGWRVENLSVLVAQLAAKGVVFERYPFLAQDDLGVWTAPDGAARVAWFKDPDGNLLSLSQHGPDTGAAR